MKLWLLEANRGLALEDRYSWSWDMNIGFVIRAETEAEARALADREPGDEPKGAWTNSKYSTCEELEVDGGEGIVLVSFNAG